MSALAKSNVISSLFWKLFEKGGRAVVELLVQIIMARLLVPEEFGALAIMLVFVNVGNVIVQSGLNTALVQVPDVGGRDCSTVFWLSLGVSLVLYVAVFACAPLFASFYAMPHIVWPLRALALVLVVNSFNAVQVAIVQRALEFRKVFNATIASVAVSGVLGVASALAGAGLWALVVQQLAYQIANCAALALQVRWRPRAIFDAGRAWRLFSFGWKLLASGLLDQGYQSLSDLIIGKQFSAGSLGLVSQGKKYPMAVGSMLDGAIQPVMLSAVSRVQDDITCVKRLVRRALKTSTYLIVPSMVAFALVAEPLVRLLLGEQWLGCVPFLQMYCFVYALLPIHTTNLQAINGVGRSDLFLGLELVKKAYGLVVMLFAAFVLRDIYFLVGSYMLTAVVGTFVNAWPNRKIIGYSYAEQIRDICPAFLLAAASAAVAFPVGLLALPDLVTAALQVAVMAVAYLILSRLFKVEALSYLLNTAQELVSSRKAAR
ncbi:flippase [Rubneribacter badeniensis]|uniref:Flippase n=1 Tax=Rubneribacter badeniensis TaxID=2070688 RepID=A0A2K2U2C1_9ACTN|nr:lipopolysaccharide biosynthesis protein [Rubneribacter badeniensis]PNV64476.1 flippase [Rubneribacter badeniensis]